MSIPVTIAIPFYNAEDYLEDAIRSVFAQTYREWELILLDDGSTDRSLEIARTIYDPRVRVFSDGRNKKLAARLNEITDLANYDYIARMDADDLMSPERIETQMNIFKINSTVDVVSTGVFSVTNTKKLVGWRGEDQSDFTFDEILYKKKGIVHAALIAKKEWYKRNKYDESLPIAEDRDLWLRSSSKNDFNAVSIKEPLYIYREEGNITKEKMLKAYSLERRMYRKYCNRFPYYLLINSFVKSGLVLILNAIGKMNILQQNRSEYDLSEDLQKKYKNILSSLNAVKLPKRS